MEKTLQQLFDEYADQIKFSGGLSDETVRGYRNVFNLFLQIMPEVSTLDSLTPAMLNEFFKRISTRQRIIGRDTLKTGVKPSTIKTQNSKLNVFFVWLCKKNYIAENPLKDIKPPRVTYDDFRRLEDSDVNKIYSAITLHSDNSFILRRDTLIVSLLSFCGLRKGEFISLKVTDIDMEKKEITIRGETSKSKRPRTLKMHPTLVLHLKDYFKARNDLGLKTEWLIATKNGDRGLSREGLKHWVQSLNKKSGVKFHLHMFRHTFACKLAEANTNVFKIQKLMGHTDIKMTMKYTRSMRTEDMGEDIAKISF
jgi:integrase/recombinase XerD